MASDAEDMPLAAAAADAAGALLSIREGGMATSAAAAFAADANDHGANSSTGNNSTSRACGRSSSRRSLSAASTTTDDSAADDNDAAESGGNDAEEEEDLFEDECTACPALRAIPFHRIGMSWICAEFGYQCEGVAAGASDAAASGATGAAEAIDEEEGSDEEFSLEDTDDGDDAGEEPEYEDNDDEVAGSKRKRASAAAARARGRRGGAKSRRRSSSSTSATNSRRRSEGSNDATVSPTPTYDFLSCLDCGAWKRVPLNILTSIVETRNGDANFCCGNLKKECDWLDDPDPHAATNDSAAPAAADDDAHEKDVVEDVESLTIGQLRGLLQDFDIPTVKDNGLPLTKTALVQRWNSFQRHQKIEEEDKAELSFERNMEEVIRVRLSWQAKEYWKHVPHIRHGPKEQLEASLGGDVCGEFCRVADCTTKRWRTSSELCYLHNREKEDGRMCPHSLMAASNWSPVPSWLPAVSKDCKFCQVHLRAVLYGIFTSCYLSNLTLAACRLRLILPSVYMHARLRPRPQRGRQGVKSSSSIEL